MKNSSQAPIHPCLCLLVCAVSCIATFPASAVTLVDSIAAPAAPRADEAVKALKTKIYALTDEGRFAEALDMAEAAVERYPASAGLWLVKGYAHRRSQEAGLALLSYEKVLQLEPSNADAFEGKVYALEDMGSAALAWQTAQQQPALFDAATTTRLRQAYAVDLMKLHGTASNPLTDFKLLDEAIEQMKRNTHPKPADIADLLMALNKRQQHAEVIRQYESAKVNPGIGAWADASVAASYSELKRYTEAVAILEQAHKTRPLELEISYALVYALCDLQRFGDAQALTGELLGGSAKTRRSELPFVRQLQAQVSMWAGDLTKAGIQLSEALALYPQNVGLQHARAAWLNSIGQSRAALVQFDALVEADPLDIEARLTALEVRGTSSPAETREELAALQHKHPGDARVARAQENFERSQRGSVFANTSYGGDRDSKTRTTTLEVDSPAIGPRGTRLVVERTTVTDWLAEGTAHHEQLSMGVRQPLSADWSASASAVRDSTQGAIGVRLKLSGQLGESSRVVFRATTLDADVPARAVVRGITASSQGAEWQAHLSPQLKSSASISHQRLTDGNDRVSGALGLTGTITSIGNLRLDWAARAGSDKASRSDVPYFSPRSAYWTQAELGGQLSSWTIAPGQNLSIRPFVSVGSFTQQGFGTLATYGAGIGINWSVTKSISLGFDVHSMHRPYDGKYTTLNSGQATVTATLP